MKLSDLIELLQEYSEEVGPDAEVRLMTQQNWPFENNLCGVCSGQEINDCSDEDDEESEDKDSDVEVEKVVYLVEGGQICYGSKRAWEVARRS